MVYLQRFGRWKAAWVAPSTEPTQMVAPSSHYHNCLGFASRGISQASSCLNHLRPASKRHLSARCHHVPGTTPPSIPVAGQKGVILPHLHSKAQVQKRPTHVLRAPRPETFAPPHKHGPRCSCQPLSHITEGGSLPLGMAGSQSPHINSPTPG